MEVNVLGRYNNGVIETMYISKHFENTSAK